MEVKSGKPGYALVNGLKMYYEIHGEGSPLVLLHGGFQTIEALGPILPALAQTRQVVAIELEGHGRTADLDRTLSYAQMAEDVAGLLGQLGIAQADFVGYSLGGITAMRLAYKHPELVRKLATISSIFNNEGYYPSVTATWPGMSAEGFVGTPMEQVYLQTATNPDHWPVFVQKVKQALMDFKGWSPEDLKTIKAPTLLVIGDADLLRPEHTLELFRLLGGAREDGGMAGVPASQMAVLPGTTHFDIIYRLDLLLPVIIPFLNAPVPESR